MELKLVPTQIVGLRFPPPAVTEDHFSGKKDVFNLVLVPAAISPKGFEQIKNQTTVIGRFWVCVGNIH